MKPQSAKAKGRKLQQWVRDTLLEYFPSLTRDDIRSTSMGAGGEDVLLSAAGRKLIPFQIECKNKRSIAVYTWYDQAREHGDNEPLLIIKQDYQHPLVVVNAETFFHLLKELNDKKP